MDEKIIKLTCADPADHRLNDDITETEYFGYPLESIINAEERLANKENRSIAYFSMEFGLAPSIYNKLESKHPIHELNRIKKHEIFSNLKDMDYYHSFLFEELLDLPIYSGGLGVLAGDALKSCADLNLSVAGVGILWNKGYFKQNFWFKYGQVPEELQWDPKTYPGLVPLDKYITIPLGKFGLKLKLWKYYVYSWDKKNVVPLVLMDANLPENPDNFKRLTDQLYRADYPLIKIAQRALLGIAGIKALDALGYSIDLYHLNEGHAALAYLEAKKPLAYTCHTPVEAGHDRFHKSDLLKLLSEDEVSKIMATPAAEGDIANFTKLAMSTASYVNTVAQKHGEVTRIQFPDFRDKIFSITNGVHTPTWMSKSIAEVLDKYQDKIGPWRQDPDNLKNVVNLKDNQHFKFDLWNAHQHNKKNLCKVLKYWLLDESVFTVCWARRIAPYKRPSLILHNLERIINIAKTVGPMQIILAGKAHPSDNMGSTHIREILNKIDALTEKRDILKVLFLENYDTYISKLLASSVDVWLNNPLPPFEASGTSGMKAIANGVLQLSTKDGWVVEAAEMGLGRIFGYFPKEGELGSEYDYHLAEDSDALCQSLEEMAGLYNCTIYEKDFFYKSEWIDMMINCIAAASFFNTNRMISEYNAKIWKL
ncbi:alpha-glucan family phosphorylase [Candidatus Saganbacteria bacterium]|nr:alpha-glucan family phosphorylase [Candidatus Saganbacteria bacterium]